MILDLLQRNDCNKKMRCIPREGINDRINIEREIGMIVTAVSFLIISRQLSRVSVECEKSVAFEITKGN